MPQPATEQASLLLQPLSGTITSGESAPLTLGPALVGWRVKRLATSAGVLRYIGGEGSAASGYRLDADDPDSGWLLTQDQKIALYADGGNVDYEVARQS